MLESHAECEEPNEGVIGLLLGGALNFARVALSVCL